MEPRINSALIDPLRPVAVAVSGGGDSMALMQMAARQLDQPIWILSVDHGLRDVTEELKLVAQAAQALGLPHHVLRWQWDGTGSVQNKAREGRRAAMSSWARAQGIDQILLGHTFDDQAETVLMRIARGSGIDGLAGMASEHLSHGVRWLRPILGLRRAELRAWLVAQGIGWAEDPSNDDLRFDRVKARQMMGALTDLGLTPDRLVQMAEHARAARVNLNDSARNWVVENTQQILGQVTLDAGILLLDDDTKRRVFAAAVQWVGQAQYRPVWAALRNAARLLNIDVAATLGGTQMRRVADRVQIARELTAAAAATPWHGTEILWDGWRVRGPDVPGLHVAPLGEAVSQVPKWRRAGLWRVAAMASPAVWRAEQLVAAPALAPAEFRAERLRDFESCFDCR